VTKRKQPYRRPEVAGIIRFFGYNIGMDHKLRRNVVKASRAFSRITENEIATAKAIRRSQNSNAIEARKNEPRKLL
jgi:hypothetical protein